MRAGVVYKSVDNKCERRNGEGIETNHRNYDGNAPAEQVRAGEPWPARKSSSCKIMK